VKFFLNREMLVPVYQVLVPLFCLVMIVNNWVKHRAGEFTMRGFLFWTLIWLGLGFFAVFPDVASEVTGLTGIKDSFRALSVVAFVFLFYLSFHNLMKNDRLSRELTRVIRESALREANGKKVVREKKEGKK